MDRLARMHCTLHFDKFLKTKILYIFYAKLSVFNRTLVRDFAIKFKKYIGKKFYMKKHKS